MKKVAVAIISREIEKGETEYLLVSSKKDFGEFTGCYYPPGGHIEQGESDGEAVAREIFEELSLVVEPVRQIAETAGDVEGEVASWWECKILGGEVKIDEDEIAVAGWFTREHMKSLKLWPATRNFFDRYIPSRN